MVDHSNSRRSDMRKVMQVCIVAGTITLCLSLFLLGDAVAEDGMNGNETQNDSLTAVMCAEKSDLTMNEDSMVLVAEKESSGKKSSGKKKHPGDGGPCLIENGAGQTAADGSACTGGTACMFPGRQMCSGGTCTTVNDGTGNCTCACQ